MKTTSLVSVLLVGLSSLAIGLAQEGSPANTPDAKAAPPARTEQPATPSFQPYTGRVTGTSVNIRSGPSTNYYPICQVNEGQFVRVIGSEHGWLRISPTAGVFSLIDQTFVDKTADGKGVVNGDGVWVRAASILPEHSRKKYAKQVKLDRGTILILRGETEDGFYMISPPKDASVWIHTSLVERVSGAGSFVWKNGEWTYPEAAAKAIESTAVARNTDESDAPAESVKPETVTTASAQEPTEKGTPIPAADNASAGPAPEKPAEAKPLDKKQIVDQEKLIAAIEKDLEAEFKKPLLQRNFPPLIRRFEPIARQESESVTKIYAQQRIRQLKDQLDAIARVKHVNSLAQNVLDARRQFSEQRKSIIPLSASAEGKYVVRGQFVKSMVYSNPVGPRRYRIIDPNSIPSKTLAYVEVPPGREFHPQLYFGRFVGVRASGRLLQQGVVKPLPIFLLEGVDLLQESDVLVQAPAGEAGQVHAKSSRVTEAGLDEETIEQEVDSRLAEPEETSDGQATPAEPVEAADSPAPEK